MKVQLTNKTTKTQNRLLIVDGSAVLYRAYHAMPRLTDRRGRATGAVYGFVRMLLRAMKDLRPTHVAVAFDRPEPTFRKQIYVAYQAQRPEPDEDLVEQFKRVRELLEAMEIPVYERAGFEADDVLGTICFQIESKYQKLNIKNQKYKLNIKKNPEFSSEERAGRIQRFDETTRNLKLETGKIETIILTGDKDMMQLVDEQVKLALPVKGTSEIEVVDVARVEEKLGVPPDQVVDLKALTGDTSDNYPGVPGVGPKTAVALLVQYGKFDKIYQKLNIKNQKHKPKIKKTLEDANKMVMSDSVKKKLVAGKESGELSLRLAEIRKDVPIEFDLEKCRSVVNNPGRLARALEDFGFTSLVKQMGLEGQVGGEQMSLI
jgi:DNA polymerase-1